MVISGANIARNPERLCFQYACQIVSCIYIPLYCSSIWYHIVPQGVDSQHNFSYSSISFTCPLPSTAIDPQLEQSPQAPHTFSIDSIDLDRRAPSSSCFSLRRPGHHPAAAFWTQRLSWRQSWASCLCKFYYFIIVSLLYIYFISLRNL